MKKKYLILGGLVLGALALAKKYTNFVDKLSFRIKKAKVKLPFPYNTAQIILTCEIDNPSSTSATLHGLTGDLSVKGKQIATIFASGFTLKQGKNEFEATANFSMQNLENVLGLEFDFDTFSSVYNELIKTQMVSDITYRTSLGNFNSKDTWTLQDLL